MIWVSAAGAAAALAGWASYLALIPRERVPARPVPHIVLMAGAVLAGVAGAVLQPTVAGILLGLTATALGGYFLWLLTQAAVPAGAPAVAVGDRLPGFEALADDGSPVSSVAFAGSRLFLKFYRGHW